MKKLLLILVFLAVSSCKQAADKVVEVVTGSILEPVSVTLSRSADLGEQVVGSDPIVISMEIKNNSSNPIVKMQFNIDAKQNVLKFNEDLDGLSSTPGYGGNCGERLSPGAKCSYKISFIPRKVGVYSVATTFNYENLIEGQKKDITFSAIVGEPASLVFTNDISNYDLGVVEQTEVTRRTLDLDIQNVGGLSARNIIFALDNDNPTGAYEVLSNDCPKVLKGSEKCKIRLGYTPHNNNYSDAPIYYTGKYSLEYLKDPSDNSGKLNAYLTFLSVAIEANFKANFPNIDFQTVVAGNTSTKTVKINNTGYRAGTMKEMSFFDYQGNKITTCQKAASGTTLDCQKNLVDFPFIVEDTNNCFRKDVQGIVGKMAGESCFFNITYWPSTTYQAGSQATHNFNNSTVSLVYDSQWTGLTNIVTKNSMFTILADFTAAGKLVLDKVEFENIPLLDTSIAVNGHVYEADLGRIALISSATYYSLVKITLRNTGENIVTLKSMKDAATPTPHEITEDAADLNAFYKQIRHNTCLTVNKGAICTISFNLAPVAQTPASLESPLMYDDYTTNPLRKFKSFIANYTDGSTYEDDGSAAANRRTEVRLIAKLVRKGYLTIDNAAATVLPSIVNGKSSVHNIYLKNVGTGDVYAVVKDASKYLEPKANQNFYPFRVMDVGTVTPPATKDCYDILYAANSTPATMPASVDVNKILVPGESCVLSVENKLSEATRMTETDYSVATNYTRAFSPNLNGTQEIWSRSGYTQSAVSVNFKYYDGDTDDAVPSSKPYGYLNATKDVTLASSFSSPANVVLKDPLPATSALFRRPGITYPAISSSYPTTHNLAAKMIPAVYFDASYFSTVPATPFSKSVDAITHVTSLGLTGGSYDAEYQYHAGTFPINQTSTMQFSFFNAGGTGATNVTLTEESQAASFPIQIKTFNGMAAKPYATFTMPATGKSDIVFNFAPTTAGTYKRCYTLTYDSGLDSRNQYVCVYAEALAATPKIKIEYLDVTITQSGSTVSESETGSFVALNTPMNSFDLTSFATFSSIKDSIVYAKKRIKFSNIGTASATKFNYYYMDTPVNAATLLPSDTTISTSGLAKPCTANITIAASDYCEIYITFKPTASSTATVLRYLGTIFDMASGRNQYVSYTGYMQFLALDPAKLSVVKVGTAGTAVTSEVVVDWSNPAAPTPLNTSFPMDVGAYNVATNGHMILTSNPSSKTITNVEVKNTSALKASFLSMFPNPAQTAPTAAAWNTIWFTSGEMKIEANRACLYGDDEANAGIPAAEKGFNSTSVNKCYLQVTFYGSKLYDSCSAWNAATKTKSTVLGQTIVANCNPYVYPLTYWNYKRSASSILYLHMKGFIEPDRVTTSTPVLSSVTAVGTSATAGTVSFSWPALTPATSGWGSITKYRVYYDTSYANLNGVNVFKMSSTIPYKETASASARTVTITGLTAGTYYYFKVFAVRNYAAASLNYLSNSNIPILALPIPTNKQFYNHSLTAMIDNGFKSTPGTRPVGVTTCAADYYSLNINSVLKKAAKSLITSSVFAYLKTSASLNVGYPNEGIGAIPHWLGDAAYDIKGNFTIYNGNTVAGFPNYVAANLSGNNPSLSLLYQKSCNNNAACDSLFKILGGDGVDLYYQGTFFAPAAAVSAYYRCYAVIPCPTDTTKLISDVACAKP